MRPPELPAPVFALVTPFAADGTVDTGALRDYLAFLHEAGAPTVIAGGTTGEFPSLALAERRDLLAAVRADFPGRVIANASANNHADARTLLRHAAECADAALLLPPAYYRGMPAAGIAAWYAAVLADGEAPVLLYDFPRHTGNPLTAESTANLARAHPRVVGFKDSSGDLAHAAAVAAALPAGAPVFFGGDHRALAALEAGLAGPVTGAANPLPRPLVELVAAWRRDDAAVAEDRQAVLTAWRTVWKGLGLPEIGMIKAALARILPGFPARVRPPQVPAPATGGEALAAALRAATG